MYQGDTRKAHNKQTVLDLHQLGLNDQLGLDVFLLY